MYALQFSRIWNHEPRPRIANHEVNEGHEARKILFLFVFFVIFVPLVVCYPLPNFAPFALSGRDSETAFRLCRWALRPESKRGPDAVVYAAFARASRITAQSFGAVYGISM